MDIYDDLERFKQQIQQKNIDFQQFDTSIGHELNHSGYQIFNQLIEHFAQQSQAVSRFDKLNDFEADLEVTSVLHNEVSKLAERSEAPIFDSVSEVSSKQSLERLLHSAGLVTERESAVLPAAALVGSN